jgi:hypothetical protein
VTSWPTRWRRPLEPRVLPCQFHGVGRKFKMCTDRGPMSAKKRKGPEQGPMTRRQSKPRVLSKGPWKAAPKKWYQQSCAQP